MYIHFRTATTKTTSMTSTKPITDKMTKDSTNKQISASRPTPAPRTGLAPKVSDLKVYQITLIIRLIK